MMVRFRARGGLERLEVEKKREEIIQKPLAQLHVYQESKAQA